MKILHLHLNEKKIILFYLQAIEGGLMEMDPSPGVEEVSTGSSEEDPSITCPSMTTDQIYMTDRDPHTPGRHLEPQICH